MSEPVIIAAAHHLPPLDWHASPDASGPGSRRRPGSDPIRLLRAFHVDDPVAGEKFLRFREDSIRNGLPVLSRSNDLGLAGESQALGGHELARIFQFLSESA